MEEESSAGLKKLLVCVLLVGQMSLQTLLLRYSKTARHVGEEQYIASVSVVVVEIIKIVFCGFVVLLPFSHANDHKSETSLQTLREQVLTLAQRSVPSFLFIIQNNLIHIGIAIVDVPYFLVIKNSRILWTALFSVYLLNKTYSWRKRWSLLFLFLGVVISKFDSVLLWFSADEDVTNNKDSRIYALAILSLFIATLTSSLASAYTEKVLKNKTSASIWVENIYMSLFGVVFSLLYCLTDIEIILEKGVFSGWNHLTTLLVINQAIGGLVVAAVIKYTSAVTKSIIGSLVMIIGTIFSTLYMGSSLSVLLVLGSVVCFVSTYYYSTPEPKHSNAV